MNELNRTDVELVSGGWYDADAFITYGSLGAALTRSPVAAAGMAGFALGTYQYNNSFSQFERDAIGYTTYQLWNNPVQSVSDAWNYWF